MFLLDALVLGRKERGEALGAKKDQGAAPDHEETDTDVPAKAVDRGAAAIGRRRAHIAVTARSPQLCAATRRRPLHERLKRSYGTLRAPRVGRRPGCCHRFVAPLTPWPGPRAGSGRAPPAGAR